jgi:hypothetical protein
LPRVYIAHRDNSTSKLVSEIRKMNLTKVKNKKMSIIDQGTKTSFILCTGVII